MSVAVHQFSDEPNAGVYLDATHPEWEVWRMLKAPASPTFVETWFITLPWLYFEREEWA